MKLNNLKNKIVSLNIVNHGYLQLAIKNVQLKPKSDRTFLAHWSLFGMVFLTRSTEKPPASCMYKPFVLSLISPIWTNII